MSSAATKLEIQQAFDYRREEKIKLLATFKCKKRLWKKIELLVTLKGKRKLQGGMDLLGALIWKKG